MQAIIFMFTKLRVTARDMSKSIILNFTSK